MLSNTLNTNEIKNSAGTEVEFQRLQTGPGRQTEFALITETPSLPHRMSVKQTESGTGIRRRRRSVVRFDKTTISGVDSVTPVTNSCYVVGDFAVGGDSTSAEMANVVAELMSFMASLGASTTILYDGTGNGAVALLTGGL
jgi:hypothetical protein